MGGRNYLENILFQSHCLQKYNYEIFPFSILGIDSAVEGPRELHVNIPEEQETTATIASNVEQQPPSYIEEQETTAAIASNVEQQPPSYQEAMSKICDTSNDNEGQRSNGIFVQLCRNC